MNILDIYLMQTNQMSFGQFFKQKISGIFVVILLVGKMHLVRERGHKSNFCFHLWKGFEVSRLLYQKKLALVIIIMVTFSKKIADLVIEQNFDRIKKKLLFFNTRQKQYFFLRFLQKFAFFPFLIIELSSYHVQSRYIFLIRT